MNLKFPLLSHMKDKIMMRGVLVWRRLFTLNPIRTNTIVTFQHHFQAQFVLLIYMRLYDVYQCGKLKYFYKNVKVYKGLTSWELDNITKWFDQFGISSWGTNGQWWIVWNYLKKIIHIMHFEKTLPMTY